MHTIETISRKRSGLNEFNFLLRIIVIVFMFINIFGNCKVCSLKIFFQLKMSSLTLWKCITADRRCFGEFLPTQAYKFQYYFSLFDLNYGGIETQIRQAKNNTTQKFDLNYGGIETSASLMLSVFLSYV